MKKILTGLLILVLALAGCGKSSSQGDDSEDVTLYLLNKGATAIQEVTYTPKADPDSSQDMINELLDRLSQTPADASMRQPIRGFKVNEVSEINGKGTVTVDFSGGYSKMDTITETLTRTAVVYTLCEVKSVKYVAFTVDGEELKDADGNTVGNMDTDEFIYNSGTEMMNYVKTRLHLYFTDKTGKVLRDAYRSVVYNSSMSMERLVLEQLIAGPNNNDSFSPTLNPDTEIISVTERDDICYVNLSAACQKGLEGVEPEVALYSIVNSLTDLPQVSKVQISIDGDPDAVFQDKISLSDVFEQNTDLMK